MGLTHGSAKAEVAGSPPGLNETGTKSSKGVASPAITLGAGPCPPHLRDSPHPIGLLGWPLLRSGGSRRLINGSAPEGQSWQGMKKEWTWLPLGWAPTRQWDGQGLPHHHHHNHPAPHAPQGYLSWVPMPCHLLPCQCEGPVGGGHTMARHTKAAPCTPDHPTKWPPWGDWTHTFEAPSQLLQRGGQPHPQARGWPSNWASTTLPASMAWGVCCLAASSPYAAQAGLWLRGLAWPMPQAGGGAFHTVGDTTRGGSPHPSLAGARLGIARLSGGGGWQPQWHSLPGAWPPPVTWGQWLGGHPWQLAPLSSTSQGTWAWF